MSTMRISREIGESGTCPVTHAPAPALVLRETPHLIVVDIFGCIIAQGSNCPGLHEASVRGHSASYEAG